MRREQDSKAPSKINFHANQKSQSNSIGPKDDQPLHFTPSPSALSLHIHLHYPRNFHVTFRASILQIYNIEIFFKRSKRDVRLQEIRRYSSTSSPTSPSRTLLLTDLPDAILTSKYNKPFPVTLLPSAIGYYLGLKQGERQAQLLREIQALDIHDHEKVKYISQHPK